MKKKIFFMLSMIVCLVLLAGCISVEQLSEQAVSLERSGDYAGAIEKYEKALKKEPENVELYKKLCEARIRVNADDTDAWIGYLGVINEHGGVDELLKLVEELNGYVPEDAQVKELFAPYRPYPVKLCYNMENNGSYSVSQVLDGNSYEEILEAAFLGDYEDDYNGAWPDKVWYSVNGEENTTYLDYDVHFTGNPYIYFSVPGEYKIKMKAYSSSKNLWGPETEVTFTIQEECVGTVEFSVPGGKYTTLGSVSLSSTNQDSKIYYTLDGSDPVVWDENGKPEIVGEEYESMFLLDAGTTVINARCVNDGGIVSKLATASYEVERLVIDAVYSTNSMASDGRYIYLIQDDGLYRYNYDLTDEFRIFTGDVYDVAVVDNGRTVAFVASPELEYHKDNPYYMYWYMDGEVSRGNGEIGKREIKALGNALYLSGSYLGWFSNTEEEQKPLEAQTKAKVYNDKYLVNESMYYGLSVSNADSTNLRTIAAPVKNEIDFAYAVALLDDKLFYYTWYDDDSVKYSKRISEYHFYVTDLVTGETKAYPEFDQLITSYLTEKISFGFGGVTNEAFYMFKTEKGVREWMRLDFAW